MTGDDDLAIGCIMAAIFGTLAITQTSLLTSLVITHKIAKAVFSPPDLQVQNPNSSQDKEKLID